MGYYIKLCYIFFEDFGAHLHVSIGYTPKNKIGGSQGLCVCSVLVDFGRYVCKVVVLISTPINSKWESLQLYILTKSWYYIIINISHSAGFFFFLDKELFLNYYLFIYLFIFGCVGSSSLCEGLLQLR